MNCKICESKKITIYASDPSNKEKKPIGYLCKIHDEPPHSTQFWGALSKVAKEKLKYKEKRKRSFSRKRRTICYNPKCRNSIIKKLRQYRLSPKRYKITCKKCGSIWTQGFPKTI